MQVISLELLSFFFSFLITSQSLEQTYSPAQEAVIRVHCRIAEIGYEPGAAVVARLLVHAQQIGYLVGRGGHIISEMRRGTGTSIHIFPREQIQNSGPVNDEVVQVIYIFLHHCASCIVAIYYLS